jgi:uncharacterized membrane protein
VSATLSARAIGGARARSGLRRHWPLAAVLLLAAALRLSTLDLQSFWYDEAFTPVRVLHASLSSTLHGMVHTENSPPLWYLIAWLDVRLFGDGEIALRLPSALAGIATVGVAWAIGRELDGRCCALVTSALIAVNPLFLWYSQEARVYALFALTSALALLCCVRARREPTGARMAAFAFCGSLALLTHYFAVFLLAGMVLWLLLDQRGARAGGRRACAARRRPGRSRHAVDRTLGAVEPPRSDSPVLPHRRLWGAARTRDRAFDRAAADRRPRPGRAQHARR